MTSSGAGRGVVAGHGAFAAGIISAVDKVSGRGAVFTPLSNEGLDAEGLERAMRAALDASGATVVFTDLPAGSCTLAARKVARTDPGVAVVTGATLAMLLDFALGAPGGTEALERAAAKGRSAIAVVPATKGSDAH